MSVSLVGYGLAAFAYALSAIVLLRARSPGESPIPRSFIVAAAGGALWAALLAAGDSLWRETPAATIGFEGLRYAAWIAALAGLMPRRSRWMRVVIGFCAVTSLLALWRISPSAPDAIDPRLVQWLGRGGLLLSLGGLVVVEQVLRNASPAQSLPLKLIGIAVGGQFAFDLFLYSQFELLTDLDLQAWQVRGFVHATLVPVLVVGLRRHARVQTSLFVSRQVVFFTTAILAVGAYLLLMAVGGYFVRIHGGTWGEALRLLFIAGAAVVLASLVFSESLARELRVFIAKHFYRNKYDYRVEWLRFIETVSGRPEADTRQTAIEAIAQIFDSPGGLLFLRDDPDAALEFAASWVRDAPWTASLPPIAVDSDLFRFLLDREWVIDIEEYRRAPDLYRHATLPDWLLHPGGGWRIVTPLFDRDRLLGVLVLRAPPPPFELTFEDRDLLKTVGRHVATLLAQQAADRRLTESHQFAAFSRLSAFVMHDLKNGVAQLQLVVSNAARHRQNPAFIDDAIDTIGNTVERMTRLIEQLDARKSRESRQPVELRALLQTVVKRQAVIVPEPILDLPAGAVHALADPEQLGAAIGHVLRNAQEAAGPEGRVTIALYTEEGSAQLDVVDNGPGMDPEFLRDRFFRPFDSTKGSKGMGIGAYQVREYVGQLGGAVEVLSTPGQGTRFQIRLPSCQTPPENC